MRRSLIIAAVAALALTPVAAVAGTKASASVVTIKSSSAAANAANAAAATSASNLILGNPGAAAAARRFPIGNLVQNILQRTNALVSTILARVFNISRGS